MKNFLFIALVGSLSILGSCKKQGCTDSDATNYDAEAETDNGRCEYSADVIFYLDQARHQYWMDKTDFYAPFHFFVDGSEVGELSVTNAAFETHETAPACSDLNGVMANGVCNYSHSLTDKSGSVTIEIQDEMGNAHGSVDVSLTQGTCHPVLL